MNFGNRHVHTGCIFVFLVLTGVFQVICNICTFVDNSFELSIFFFIDIFEQIIPWLIQIFLNLRAFKLKKKFLELEGEMNSIKLGSNKWQLIFYVFTIAAARLMKCILCPEINYVLACCAILFSELIFSCNDFIFVYYVDQLTDHLKMMSMTDGKTIFITKEIRKNFKVMRKVHKIFSATLFITISNNFLQLVFSLYWIVVRIIFGYLKESKGKFSNILMHLSMYYYFQLKCFLLYLDFITFLYVVQPILCLWVVFSAYENYLSHLSRIRVEKLSKKSQHHWNNEKLFVLLNAGKRSFNVGGTIELRRSTLTAMTGAITSYFFIMIQLFLINPY